MRTGRTGTCLSRAAMPLIAILVVPGFSQQAPSALVQVRTDFAPSVRVSRSVPAPMVDDAPLRALSIGMSRLREALLIQRVVIRTRAKSESLVRRLLLEDQAEKLSSAADDLASQVAALSDTRDTLNQLRKTELANNFETPVRINR